MKMLPRYHIINGMFTSPILLKLLPDYSRKMFAFLRLLFGSIDGAEEHAHTRNKVHAKSRKIGFSRNFCSAIYTYSTVSGQASNLSRNALATIKGSPNLSSSRFRACSYASAVVRRQNPSTASNAAPPKYRFR